MRITFPATKIPRPGGAIPVNALVGGLRFATSKGEATWWGGKLVTDAGEVLADYSEEIEAERRWRAYRADPFRGGLV